MGAQVLIACEASQVLCSAFRQRGARVLNHVSYHEHCAGSSRRRSHSFTGIADAMAEQWGGLL